MENAELDEKIKMDGVERAGLLEAKDSATFITPDTQKITRILHAFGNMDPEIGYQQGYPNIVTLLLHHISPEPTTEVEQMTKVFSKSEEDVFYCLMRVMHDLNWRDHFLPPWARMPFIVKELRGLIGLHLPELYAKFEEEDDMLEMVIENLYSYGIFSLCAGEKIPIDVTVRVFEVVIFEGLGDISLVRLLLYMLMIQEEDIMKIEDSGERFRYVAHGKFIVDCFQNKAYFNFLVKEYLEVDLLQFMEDERELNELKEKTKQVKVNVTKANLLATIEEEKLNKDNTTPKVKTSESDDPIETDLTPTSVAAPDKGVEDLIK